MSATTVCVKNTTDSSPRSGASAGTTRAPSLWCSASRRSTRAHDQEIDRITEERIAEMRVVVEEERQKLAGYRAALAGLEGETEEVVGAVTYATWDDVRGRFYDLVLRADVGRIDVAWARREEHRTRVDMLTRERSRELRALDDEFRDIMDERPVEEEDAE